MSEPTVITNHALATNDAERLVERRAADEAIRSHARMLFDGEATGIQVAAAISEATERFVRTTFQAAVDRLGQERSAFVASTVSLIAIGGTGRGELCPYSDVDLLVLVQPSARRAVGDCVSQAVRDFWDAGLRLGHSVRSVSETVGMARQQVDIATSLAEARLLWGEPKLFGQLTADFQKKVVRARVRAFVAECIAAREKERAEYGKAVKVLEPDVKRSPGGLRDLHLVRWLGYAWFGVADIESLRLMGALDRDDARTLLAAYDFLTRVRVDLHFAAGRCQDVLNRDEQLRIAKERQIEGTFAQLPVERFMQTYFRHSTAIAELCERFITLYRPRSLFGALLRSLATHRSERIYLVGADSIDVVRRYRERVVSSLEGILKYYRTAALYGAMPAPELTERIREAVPTLGTEISETSAQLFLDILACHGRLGSILRSMFRAGVLEIVIPPMAHARCLLQFNQYHSYTVDEHTFRTVEELERFEQRGGPLGEAYRAVRKKHVLHLAMLLHDLGKGYEDDHSQVGRGIADRMAERLRMPEGDQDLLVFLVHKHLMMAHLAFRRDTSESESILDFAREVGSAETLRMLFVLTAADVMGVGPNAWNQWKSQLLFDLYDRTLMLLSGKDAQVDNAWRRSEIRRKVIELCRDLGDDQAGQYAWLGAMLDRFAPNYLLTTPPERIASDLHAIRRYQPGKIETQGHFDEATQTVEYRVRTHENDVTGCFHKAAGVLTAKRMEIVSAQISTTTDGFVVDSFRVHDRDFAGEVPAERIAEVAAAMQDALSGKIGVEELFQRHRRYGSAAASQPISNLPARVVVDNSSSENYTVIDVFSHDRPGLLYTLSRKIFQLELSVVLAKIATHLDQVVDVFYVTDRQGQKLNDPARIKDVQATLMSELDEFEQHNCLQFAS